MEGSPTGLLLANLQAMAERLKAYAKSRGVQGFGIYLDGTYMGLANGARVMRGGEPLTLDEDEWHRRIDRMSGRKLWAVKGNGG